VNDSEDVLKRVLEQYSVEFNVPGAGNNNFADELEALLDPATYEYGEPRWLKEPQIVAIKHPLRDIEA